MTVLTLLTAVSVALQAPPSPADAPAGTRAQGSATEAYRVELMRAAPGRLLDLIAALQERTAFLSTAGDHAPLVMRHSQGDHWDLMVLTPIGSLEQHYSADRRRRVEEAESGSGLSPGQSEADLQELIAWREELFATGLNRTALARASENSGLFHIEMFIALPGKFDELVRQRYMENAYYKATHRDGNFVFTRLAGAAWDVFTLGFYEDWAEFIDEPDLPPEVFEQAAVDAGFEARNRIGTYLRELISRHNDTLAGRAF